MQYSYNAKNKEGKLIRGVVEAQNEKAVSALLHEKELYPVNIKSKSSGLSFLRKKVNTKDKIIFTQQLEIMSRSGLPITESLRSLKTETENKIFANQINQILTDVEGGLPLSEALKKHPQTFNNIYTNMVASGEKTGKLDIVFNRLAKQLDAEYELNRKIRGALTYPIFVLVVLIIVMVLVLVFVIPQLKLIFDDAGVKLPLSTQIIIKLSLFFKQFGLYVLAGLVVLSIATGQWRKSSKGQHFFDALIVRLPVIGTLMKKTYMSRFTRTFASLASSGLPLLEVFKAASTIMGNIYYQEEVEKMTVEIKNGSSISRVLRESKLFPGVISQLAAVGEKSGNTDEVFNSLADFFDRDVDNITTNLSSMLEPVLMIVMGVGIGGVIISILQPIYGLVNAI